MTTTSRARLRTLALAAAVAVPLAAGALLAAGHGAVVGSGLRQATGAETHAVARMMPETQGRSWY